jgi:glycosyltransferase involved in cell wall biosynthesis
VTLLKAVVAQRGGREHFLVARALQRRGVLARLAVDWYAPKGLLFRCFGGIGGIGRAAMSARCEEIPDRLVRSFCLRSLWWKLRERVGAGRGRLYEAYSETDAAFARAVAHLGLPPHDVFFGYSYACLETMEVERRRGALTILDQIDPGPAEFCLVAAEMAQFPELAGPPPPFPEEHFARARREWELADVIVVNSEWTKQAIVADGAEAGKIELLPLAYEAPAGTRTMDHGPRTTKPLRVLFLGQVNVRKGIRYLIEAAQMLQREPVELTVAGPLGIRPDVVAGAPRNMRWVGPVPRNRAAGLYAEADVFVLPTLSDGFAITQLEALAHGLPVVTTPNCGSVVVDEQTGFVVPARDPRALAEAIMRFVATPHLAGAMSPRCREAVKAFSIGAYGERLVEIIERTSARIEPGR